MEKSEFKTTTPRRGFLGTLAAGAASLGLAALPSYSQTSAPVKQGTPKPAPNPADAWFNKLKGKHRMVFDATHPHEMFPFAWPKVFLMTNAKTGTPETDCGVVIVLRHAAICYAFDHPVWEKYNFGALFEANDPTFHSDDPKQKVPAKKNNFWKPEPGDFKVPGIGPVNIGINDLQASGVMLCVCEMAINVYSAVAADMMKMDSAEIKKDWMAALLPGIQPVPSGVWAIGRAQEHGCAYTFAG